MYIVYNPSVCKRLCILCPKSNYLGQIGFVLSVCQPVDMLSTFTFAITFDLRRLHIWPAYSTNVVFANKTKGRRLYDLDNDHYAEIAFYGLCCHQRHSVSLTLCSYILSILSNVCAHRTERVFRTRSKVQMARNLCLKCFIAHEWNLGASSFLHICLSVCDS